MEITINIDAIKQFILMNDLTRFASFYVFVLLSVLLLLLHTRFVSFILIHVFRLKNNPAPNNSYYFDIETFIRYLVSPLLSCLLYAPILKWFISLLIFG